MSAVRIGAITIGQSPRDDVVPDLSRQLDPHVEIVQAGALDGLTLAEVQKFAPESVESTLVSRMRDGTEVEIDKNCVVPRLQAAIGALEHDVRMILVLCSASCTYLDSRVPLIHPSQALDGIVRREQVQRLGVLTPSLEQVPAQRLRWQPFADQEVMVVSASPYAASNALEDAATELAHHEVDFVVMDCIGYSEAMRERIDRLLSVRVVSALGALAVSAVELLDSKLS